MYLFQQLCSSHRLALIPPKKIYRTCFIIFLKSSQGIARIPPVPSCDLCHEALNPHRVDLPLFEPRLAHPSELLESTVNEERIVQQIELETGNIGLVSLKLRSKKLKEAILVTHL